MVPVELTTDEMVFLNLYRDKTTTVNVSLKKWLKLTSKNI